MESISASSVFNSVINTEFPNSRMNWSEFNIKVLNLYLQNVKSNFNSDFMICRGPDDLMVGNSFYRASKETMGILMESPDGMIAKEISILKKTLEGKAIVVGLESKNLNKMKDELSVRYPEVTFETRPLFENSTRTLPDDAFRQLNLKSLNTHKDLESMTEDHLNIFADLIFEKLKNNPSTLLPHNDLLEDLQRATQLEIEKKRLPCIVDLTWDALGKKTIVLALKVIQSGYKADISLYIGSGGNYVGKILSILLGTIDANLMATSYGEEGIRGKLRLAPHVSVASTDGLKGNILLIDDLVDSGTTLKETKEWVKQNHDVDEVKTAVIFKKPSTTVIPDFFAESADKRWIFMPDEVFERLNLRVIKPKDLANFSNEAILKLAIAIFESRLINPRLKISDQTIETLLSEIA